MKVCAVWRHRREIFVDSIIIVWHPTDRCALHASRRLVVFGAAGFRSPMSQRRHTGVSVITRGIFNAKGR
jgi:hypothetical protein